MTTIPSRIDRIGPALESALSQTVPVEHIELNVPYVCARTDEPYTLPTWLTEMERVKIFRTDDFGPITKIAPTLLRHKDDQETYLWSVDDDFAYPENQLAMLCRGHRDSEHRILARHGGDFNSDGSITFKFGQTQVSMFEGFGTVLYPPACIGDDFQEYVKETSKDVDCRQSDDVVLSLYFSSRQLPIFIWNSPSEIEPFYPTGSLPHSSEKDAIHLQSGGNLERYKRVLSVLKSRGSTKSQPDATSDIITKEQFETLPWIYTAHGTVLYVKVDTGELRHGPIDSWSTNVRFLSDGKQGQMIFSGDDHRLPIAFQSDCSLVAKDPKTSAPTRLEIFPKHWVWVGFHVGDTFLCAELDGRITLSRPHCLGYESFSLSEPPRSQEIFHALRLLKPYDVKPFLKTRVGCKSDGGYVILDDLDPIEIVYSFGIGNQVSFDIEMAGMGKNIFMFDHTVDGPPLGHPNFHFQKHGLAADNREAASLYTLAYQLNRLGHEGRTDLLLKIDIEGAEFEVFSAMPQAVLRQFRQITMELHWLDRLSDPTYRTGFVAALSKINDEFTLFHVHSNNNEPLGIVDGYVVAPVMELSYVRSDLIERAPSTTVYPTEFDFPNWPPRPDHTLWFYPFLPMLEESAGALERSITTSNRMVDPQSYLTR
ncbi:FkbM family methyltransferase [Mesorhizobium erdmanii]|uniref:FkbM family methyltransferase n=1 Tax=Mesorhizobium erdmanii TaxID=1777866 RepID=UPI0013784BF8|nr:FkbM family methyltransferase [Mesorhizobium erdmanii]